VDTEKLSRLLAMTRARVTALDRRSGDTPDEARALLADLLEELQTSLEELQVSEEELRQQNEELVGSRRALEAEHRRYQELFEFAPDAYLVTDALGTILEANQAAGGLLGVSQKFLTGKPLITFIPDDERRDFRSRLLRLVQPDPAVEDPATGADPPGPPAPQEWDTRLQPREQDPLDAGVRVAVTQSPDGPGLALRWLLRDITGRKATEAHSQALNVELEQRVRERTAQLEVAGRRKNEFLGLLGHELRNPLGAVSNALHLLCMRAGDDARLLRTIELMERQVRHQTRLIDDLLNVTRIARGKLSLQPYRLDLVRVVRETIEDRRSALEEAGLTLALEVPEEPILVWGDSTRLSQVLDNLLQNAIKFTDPGGQVTVSLRVEKSNKDTQDRQDEILAKGLSPSYPSCASLLDSSPALSSAVIRVRDTGIGIAPEVLPQLFDAFAQADDAAGRSQGGLGLGLALVKGLVELHGGEVRASSEGVGRGAELTVLLPLAEGEPAPEHAE
jgi:signal transduction histidine kinase